jgi:predicted lactoylglutathione lyase
MTEKDAYGAARFGSKPMLLREMFFWEFCQNWKAGQDTDRKVLEALSEKDEEEAWICTRS